MLTIMKYIFWYLQVWLDLIRQETEMDALQISWDVSVKIKTPKPA